MKENDLLSALNTNLADLHILNIKLHNYHWNVQGMQFHAIHGMTETYYNYFFGLFDDVAERILQLGDKPLATVAAYAQYSTLDEETGDSFEAVTVVKRVLADFQSLLGDAKHIVELAAKDEDIPTGNLYADHVQWLEKQIWMLKSSLG
jgi:starvation-inducible DNA-binding protein